MRFSSYNMEGRIKSKTKFINEKIQESVYDKDIPSVEQVEYFAPVFKEVD